MTQTTTNGLLQLRASELLPGDRVSFGDHTGWLKVRHVLIWPAPSRLIKDQVRIVAWPRRFKGRWEWVPWYVASADETAWVQR